MMLAAVIIGGGPAGCQCALWLHMLGYEVLIIEKSAQLGGLQCESPYINNWLVGTLNLQGHEIAENMQSHIENMKIPVFYNTVVKSIKKLSEGFEVSVGDNVFLTSTIVIASGVKAKADSLSAAENVLIGPGKKIEEFNFFKKRVAILGGGDNAAENYSFIKDKNPDKCHIYARNIRARPGLWKNVNNLDAFVGEYNVDQDLMTIKFNEKLCSYDVFVVLYGWEASIPNALLEYDELLIDKSGFIYSDEKRKTRIQGFFAAGEVTQRTHPCVATAMADGVIVAKAIQFQLEEKDYFHKVRSNL